ERCRVILDDGATFFLRGVVVEGCHRPRPLRLRLTSLLRSPVSGVALGIAPANPPISIALAIFVTAGEPSPVVCGVVFWGGGCLRLLAIVVPVVVLNEGL